jgi:chromosome segregation ATPase
MRFVAILVLGLTACETENQTVERRHATLAAAHRAAENMQSSESQLAQTTARAERAAYRERLKAELQELDTELANAYIDAPRHLNTELEAASAHRRQLERDLALVDDETKDWGDVKAHLDSSMNELRKKIRTASARLVTRPR